MPLIKDSDFIDETFTRIEDDSALPDGPVMIPLARLLAQADDLRSRNAPLGVIVHATQDGKAKQGEDIRTLAPYLDMVSCVALDFPVYRNGRGFSSARILREELGFTGDIRATGAVLYDQWAFMQRCGINVFEVAEGVTLAQFAEAMGEMSEVYQPAADGRTAVPWRR